MFREDLISAIKDYRWLLDRHYPQRSAIHIVGDRYKLTGTERSILYHGVSDACSAGKRSDKVTEELSANRIAIDCYNVLFTLTNYLLGKPVYISDDNFLRDAGEGRGRINNKEIFDRALNLLENFLSNNKDREYYLLLDAPISNSGKLAIILADYLSSSRIKGVAEAINSPDYVLQNISGAVICSSDSAIMDKTVCRIFDIPRHILVKEFSAEFYSIRKIFQRDLK